MDVAGGHFLTGLVQVLGDIASVSATFATLYPDAEIINDNNEPIGKTQRTGEDQIAFSATLKSGAILSFHFRGGLSATKPGRVPFEWIIDGEEGTIKVESDSSFYHIAHPKNVYIKGEKWEPGETLVDLTGNLGSAWTEIAKGEQGNYTSFGDAVKIHRVIDAIRRSAREGVRINID